MIVLITLVGPNIKFSVSVSLFGAARTAIYNILPKKGVGLTVCGARRRSNNDSMGAVDHGMLNLSECSVRRGRS